jgi:hypothetical protein
LLFIIISVVAGFAHAYHDQSGLIADCYFTSDTCAHQPMSLANAYYWSLGTVATEGVPVSDDGAVRCWVIAQESVDFFYIIFIATVALSRFTSRMNR